MSELNIHRNLSLYFFPKIIMFNVWKARSAENLTYKKNNLGSSVPNNKIWDVLQVIKIYRMQVGNNDETGSNVKKFISNRFSL